MPREFPLACFHQQAIACVRPGNVQLSLSFGRTIDPALWRRSWERMVLRHPVLRSTFGASGGSTIEHDHVDLAWHETDWRELDPDSIAKKWPELLDGEKYAEFAPGSAPLWRIHLLALPGESHHLLWTMHPALLDYNSCSAILLEWFVDVDRGAEGECSGTPGPAAALCAVDLPDDCAEVVDACMGLEDCALNPFLLLGGGLRPAANFWTAQEQIQPGLVATIAELARELQAPAEAVLAAGWAAFLARCSRTGDGLLGVVLDIKDRLPSGHDDVCGWFDARLPLRFGGPHPGSREWLGRFLGGWQRLGTCAFTPWWKSAALAARDRGLPQVPISEFCCRGPGITDRLHTLLPQWLCADAVWSSPLFAPLTVAVGSGRGLQLEIACEDSVLPQSESRFLLDGWSEALAGLGKNPAPAVVFGPPSLPDTELFRLDSEPDLGHRLEAQLRARGGQSAVNLGSEEMTASDLLALSNQLCRYLRRVKTPPGAAWVVGMRPSPWLTVALLSLVRDRHSFLLVDPGLLADPGSLSGGRPLAGILTAGTIDAAAPSPELRTIVVDTEWEKISELATGPLPARKVGAPPVWSFRQDGDPAPHDFSEQLLAGDLSLAPRVLRLEPGDRLLSTAPAGSVTLFLEIFSSLVAEAVHVFSTTPVFATRSAFQEAIESNGITHLWLPAPRWAEWVHFLVELGRAVPVCLKHLHIDAGRFPAPALSAWEELAKAGPSMSVGYSPWGGLGAGWSAEAADAFQDRMSGGIPLGFVPDGYRAAALDAAGLELAPGMAGHLALAPPGGLPAANPETAFSLLGCQCRDGIWRSIAPPDVIGEDFQDRTCRLVEAALQRHPEVFDCLAAKASGQPGAFHAWLIMRETGGVLPRDLPEVLRRAVPEFELQAAVVLPRYPLDDRGRVRGHALPDPLPFAAMAAPARIETGEQTPREDRSADVEYLRLLETNGEPTACLVVCEKEPGAPVAAQLASSGAFAVAAATGSSKAEDLAAAAHAFAAGRPLHLIGVRELAWEAVRAAMYLAKADALNGELLLVEPPVSRGPAGFGAIAHRLRNALPVFGSGSLANIRKGGGASAIRCPLPAKVLLAGGSDAALRPLLPSADFYQASLGNPAEVVEAVHAALCPPQPPGKEDSSGREG